MDISASSETGLAPHACASCRKNKRRCDKELPSCYLCTRTGRFCDYSYLPQVGSPSAVNDLRDRVVELEQRVLQLDNSTSDAHTPTALSFYTAASSEQNYPNIYVQAFYLDSDVWSSCDLIRQPSHINTPAEVVACLGNIEEIKLRYFNSVHTWMPIISKVRLSRLTHSEVGRTNADVALLLLCMKSIDKGVSDNNLHSSNLYLRAKELSAALERKGLVTLRSLQANLLLVVYELGHAIYPAATFTLSSCVRQGIALGLHNKAAAHHLGGKIRRWVDWEERQRAWWMIVILDRFIMVGSSNQPLCTEDPSMDTILPSCESAWDSGMIVPPVRVLLSSIDADATLVSPFARLGQAANLLGRVIRHCDHLTSDIDHVLKNAELLFGTITSLLDILAADNHTSPQSSDVAIAFCLSALFKLADFHSCIDINLCGEQTDMETGSRVRALMQHSLHTIERTCEQVLSLIQQLPQGEGQSRANISPFHIHCIYSCAANYAWMASETGNIEYFAAKTSCEHMLHSIQRIWGSAGVYLELLRLADASSSA